MKFLKTYNQLFEVHYTDKYPQSFLDFRQKWNKYKKYNYYVQFTNHKDNNIDKSAYNKTDHHDPMGNYGYPLDYVIDYPMDVWYGANAKYLRVLQSTAKNTLWFTEIKDRYDCRKYLDKIYNTSYEDLDLMINRARNIHGHRVKGSSTTWAKTFFQCVQIDYLGNVDNGEYRVRSSEEQTKLFIKGGWDALVDESKSINTAIINDREPNQIVFLKSTAFKVVDVFKLTDKEHVNKYITSPDHKNVLGKKWASKILNVLDGDKIKEKVDTSDVWYFSVKGREILLEFREKDFSYTHSLKFGQKRHKVHKLHDDYIVSVSIDTEYGEIKDKLYNDNKLDELLESIQYKWDKIKQGEILKDWKPRTLALKKEEDEAERKEQYEKEYKEEQEKALKLYPRWKGRMEYWSNKFDIPFEFYDFDVMYQYMKRIDSLNYRLPSHLTNEKAWKEIQEHIEHLSTIDEEDGRIYLKIWYGEDSDKNLKNAINFNNIIYEIFKVQKEPIIFTFWNYDEK